MIGGIAKAPARSGTRRSRPALWAALPLRARASPPATRPSRKLPPRSSPRRQCQSVVQPQVSPCDRRPRLQRVARAEYTRRRYACARGPMLGAGDPFGVGSVHACAPRLLRLVKVAHTTGSTCISLGPAAASTNRRGSAPKVDGGAQGRRGSKPDVAGGDSRRGSVGGGGSRRGSRTSVGSVDFEDGREARASHRQGRRRVAGRRGSAANVGPVTLTNVDKTDADKELIINSFHSKSVFTGERAFPAVPSCKTTHCICLTYLTVRGVWEFSR